MMAFADICVLFAQQTVQDPRAGMLQTVGLMVFMGLAMYFLMFRPQQKKAREHAEMLKTIANQGVIYRNNNGSRGVYFR